MAATKIHKTCPQCGKAFETTRKEQKFCGRRCVGLHNRVGGVTSRVVKARAGRRPDLGNIYFRSAWESNYARYLNLQVSLGEIEGWQYEPKTFYFPVKRGNRSYTPDFLVQFHDSTTEWRELKGWMDQNSKVKLNRFARHYPDEKLVIIDRQLYKDIESNYSAAIEGWE